jgi:hypothetical protein
VVSHGIDSVHYVYHADREVSDVVISITLRPVKVLMLLKLEVLVVA